MSNRVHCFSGTLSRPRSKRIETTSNGGVGWTSIPDGSESATIELEIDIDWIIRDLGERAMRSKRNTARGLSGAIKAKAVNRSRHP